MNAELQILSAGAVLENYAKLEAALHNREQPGKINQLIEKLIKSIRRELAHGSGHDETRLKFLVTPKAGRNC